MALPTRSAGWGTTADGSLVTWTVAEGSKGRRWREVVTRESAVTHSLLLETGPTGRFAHLELARLDGLWTLHPERDGTLHGNHVDRGEPGIRHFTGLPFGEDHTLLVEGSPLSLAVIAWGCADSVEHGAVAEIESVVLGAGSGSLGARLIRVERWSRTGWRIDDGALFEVDDAGLPRLDGGQVRPLDLG